jgi:hypothetical protein
MQIVRHRVATYESVKGPRFRGNPAPSVKDPLTNPLTSRSILVLAWRVLQRGLPGMYVALSGK